MQRFIRRLTPFIMLGIIIVFFAFGLVILAYLFMIGAIVGLILFLISWLRIKFFPPKTPVKRKKKSGRIIDSDDWRIL